MSIPLFFRSAICWSCACNSTAVSVGWFGWPTWTRERLAALKPSVVAFAAQTGCSIEVRTIAGFHDRYLFVDGQACYQSGASFKDGAKKAPTVLIQISDAFVSVRSTYEQLWLQAGVV